MCGIGGILRVTPPSEKHEPIPDEWLDLLDEGIAWRGPDGSGRFRDTVTKPDGTIIEVALVHRRLAIIDLEGGAQPMVSERGRTRDDGTREGLVAVVFNGCIYNHRELRAELEAKGHEFATDHSDTEVLIHGWREWGPSFPARLDGMYAFALWDRESANLICARDSAGEKPLYAARNGQLMVFASGAAPIVELCVRLCAQQISAPDRPNLLDWVALGFTPETTPSQGVAQLASGAAHSFVPMTLSKTEQRALRQRYEPIQSLDDLEHELRAAVESRLESDVPLGCFLSGGIDSSIIAAFAQRALGNLTTLNLRMPTQPFDESPHAASVAEHLGTRHIQVDCDSSDAASDLTRLIGTIGLPFGDSSLLPTYWLCRHARTHVKVALSGDGGDEAFVGYERYKACRWFLSLPIARLALMCVPIDRLDRHDPRSSSERLARLVSACRHRGYTDLLAIFDSRDFARLTRQPPGPMFKKWRFDPASIARQFDFQNYLPGDLMRKIDSASMLAGMEVRSPMLATALIQRAAITPLSRLAPGLRPKWFLRQLAARYLPPEIINRPKQGFAIPLSDWWRSDFGNLRALMLDHLTSTDPFPGLEALNINMDYVRQMIDEHMAAGPAGAPAPIAQLSPRTKHIRPRDHAQRLYMLTVLAIWARWLRREIAKEQIAK